MLLVWGRLIDCAVTADSATIAAIENVMSAVDADVVYVHAPDDSHQDHRAAAAATEAFSPARFVWDLAVPVFPVRPRDR